MSSSFHYAILFRLLKLLMLCWKFLMLETLLVVVALRFIYKLFYWIMIFNFQMEQAVLASGSNKKLVLLLNKIGEGANTLYMFHLTLISFVRWLLFHYFCSFSLWQQIKLAVTCTFNRQLSCLTRMFCRNTL